MAIDSKAKRFSMFNFGEDCALLPDPDGSFDQGDRQHFLGLYSGILASAPGGYPFYPYPLHDLVGGISE